MDGFTPLTINLDGDGAWPELADEDYVVGDATHVAALVKGTVAGKPAVLIRGRTEDGQEVVLQTTRNLFCSAARAIEARYGPPE